MIEEHKNFLTHLKLAMQIDKDHFEFCSLCSKDHVKNSLGEPLELPAAISTSLDEPEGAEENLKQLFRLMKGCDYELVIRDNSYNYETDLDQFFVYSVYAPKRSNDWLWQRDCFVLIEMGYPGDPRYSGYRTAEVYDLGDDCLAETGFFDWILSWHASPVDKGCEQDLERLNEALSSGYTSSPTYELSQLCEGSLVWNEELEGFVGQSIEFDIPLVFRPYGPSYAN